MFDEIFRSGPLPNCNYVLSCQINQSTNRDCSNHIIHEQIKIKEVSNSENMEVLHNCTLLFISDIVESQIIASANINFECF